MVRSHSISISFPKDCTNLTKSLLLLIALRKWKRLRRYPKSMRKRIQSNNLMRKRWWKLKKKKVIKMKVTKLQSLIGFKKIHSQKEQLLTSHHLNSSAAPKKKGISLCLWILKLWNASSLVVLHAHIKLWFSHISKMLKIISLQTYDLKSVLEQSYIWKIKKLWIMLKIQRFWWLEMETWLFLKV